MEQTKKRKFTVGHHHGNLNTLPSTYQLPPMTCSQLIVNCLIWSVYDNSPPLWTLISKEVKYIKNGNRMCNMMKLFMSAVNIVAIDKLCCKYKMKYWYYISAINVWDNVQNDFNIKYVANNLRKKLQGKQFTIACHIWISFRIHIMQFLKFFLNNHSQ